MKKWTIITIALSLFCEVSAQIDRMAYDIATPTLNGTARFVGTGGTLNVVGGDIGSANVNPAGIGVMTKSEFTFTPHLQFNSTNGSLGYLDGRDNRFKNEIASVNEKLIFGLENLGIAVVNRRKMGALHSSNFAITINRTHDFNREYDFAVLNDRYTLFDYMGDTLTRIFRRNPSLFGGFQRIPLQNISQVMLDSIGLRETMILGNGGLFIDLSDSTVFSPNRVNSTTLQQGYSYTRGNTTELGISWAGSIKDQTYVGVSLGIPFVSHTTTKFYKDQFQSGERYNDSIYGNHVSTDFIERDEYTGAGINLKLGIIQKIAKIIRLSAYFHTPTYVSLTNNYSLNVLTHYNRNGTSIYPSGNNGSLYEDVDLKFIATTPLRVGGGAAVFLGKFGFLSAEYEFNPTNNTRIRDEDFVAFQAITNVLNRGYVPTTTLRIGGEFAYDMLRLRLGANIMSSPYSQNNIIIAGADMSQRIYTASLGFRAKKVSIDATYVRREFTDYNFLYPDLLTNNGSEYAFKPVYTNSRVLLTFAFRF